MHADLAGALERIKLKNKRYELIQKIIWKTSAHTATIQC